MTHKQPNNKPDMNGRELVLPPEACHALERAVCQFCKTHPCPHGYSPDEWRADCHGEAWAIVPDVLRTYTAAKGCLETYLYKAVKKHLTRVYAKECRWHQCHPLLLDAPLPAEEQEGASRGRWWMRPATVGRRSWGGNFARPFVLLLMALQAILPLWARDTVQFPPDYYTYPEIAKRLSVGGRTVVCARSLQERLALVALRPRGWEEAVALLSRGLDIRVRLVDKERQVWQMEPEPQQAAFEEEVYATWQRLVEEEFRQRWEVLFSLQLSEGDWQVLEELVQWVRLQQEHSSEWALSDLPVELGRLSAGLRGWLDRVSSLPRGLYRELFGRWLVDREARQRYVLYWLVSNRRGEPDTDRALILSLLSLNRGRLVPDWREALEGLVSRRGMSLGEAVMSQAVQHRLLSLWGLASAQQLSSCYLSVSLRISSIYKCELTAHIGKCVSGSERLSVLYMMLKECSFAFSLPVFAMKEMDDSLEGDGRAERFLEGLSEELGRRWREYRVREAQLLQSPMAQRSFECYSSLHSFTLNGLLFGWSLATQTDVIMEIFPVRDHEIYFPVPANDPSRAGGSRVKLSLQELLKLYVAPYSEGRAGDRVSNGRLLFYEVEGVLFAYNPHSFMERRLGLPLATAKAVLWDLGREPLERIREYHRRTTLLQNLKVKQVAEGWGLQKALMIDGAVWIEPLGYLFTSILLDIWRFGELLKGGLVDLFGVGKLRSGRVEIEIEQLPKSFVEKSLQSLFLVELAADARSSNIYTCGFDFERLSGKLVIEVNDGVDLTREEEVKKHPGGEVFRRLWRAGIDTYSFRLEPTGSERSNKKIERFDDVIGLHVRGAIFLAFHLLSKSASSDRR